MIHASAVRERHDLRALRLSRVVAELLAARESLVAVVHSVFRRVANLRLDSTYLLSLSAPEVALAPNGIAVDLPGGSTMAGAGLQPGQAGTLSALGLQIPEAGLHVAFHGATRWEPRPRVGGADAGDVASAACAVRATLVAEGAPDSLLPLLWLRERADRTRPADPVSAAAAPAALLCAAAARHDPWGVRAASKRLAGLGPGLTPSGDDLLAGFLASWVLTCEATGVQAGPRDRVASEILQGAAPRASELGGVWLAHAVRGAVAEPMGRFFTALFAGDLGSLPSAVRSVLALGATSGTDWLVGAVLGIEAALHPDCQSLGRAV